MRKHLVRVITVVMLAAVLLQGCILSRLTDRGFLGFVVDKPLYPNRIYTGLFLVTIAGAVDIVTTPIQLLLLVILGDDFPFYDTKKQKTDGEPEKVVALKLEQDKNFARLTPAQQLSLREFLQRRVRERPAGPPPVIGVTAKGEWVEVPVDSRARQELLARATTR